MITRCGNFGPCACEVCNLTRAAEDDAVTAIAYRESGDLSRAARYEADVDRIRRALRRAVRRRAVAPS